MLQMTEVLMQVQGVGLVMICCCRLGYFLDFAAKGYWPTN